MPSIIAVITHFFLFFNVRHKVRILGQVIQMMKTQISNYHRQERPVAVSFFCLFFLIYRLLLCDDDGLRCEAFCLHVNSQGYCIDIVFLF